MEVYPLMSVILKYQSRYLTPLLGGHVEYFGLPSLILLIRENIRSKSAFWQKVQLLLIHEILRKVWMEIGIHNHCYVTTLVPIVHMAQHEGHHANWSLPISTVKCSSLMTQSIYPTLAITYHPRNIIFDRGNTWQCFLRNLHWSLEIVLQQKLTNANAIKMDSVILYLDVLLSKTQTTQWRGKILLEPIGQFTYEDTKMAWDKELHQACQHFIISNSRRQK